MSEIETGKKQPSEKILNMIASIFNVNIDWLLTGSGNIYVGGKEEDVTEKDCREWLKMRFNMDDEEIDRLFDVQLSDRKFRKVIDTQLKSIETFKTEKIRRLQEE